MLSNFAYQHATIKQTVDFVVDFNATFCIPKNADWFQKKVFQKQTIIQITISCNFPQLKEEFVVVRLRNCNHWMKKERNEN